MFIDPEFLKVITEIKVLTTAMLGLKVAAEGAAIATAAATRIGFGLAGIGAVGLAAVGNQSFTPTLPGGAVSSKGAPGQTINNNITVQSLDSESAARAVSKVINESASRSIPLLTNRSVRGN